MVKGDITIYRIRNCNNGLFSTGSMDPSWVPAGKIWKKYGMVVAYLRHFKEHCFTTNKSLDFYKEAEIVGYDPVNEVSREKIYMYRKGGVV